jgi:hypothetical protein
MILMEDVYLLRCHILHTPLTRHTHHTHLEGRLEVLIHQEEVTVALQVFLLPAQVKVEMLAAVLQALEAVTIAVMVTQVAVLLIQIMQQLTLQKSHLTSTSTLRLLLTERAKVKRDSM